MDINSLTKTKAWETTPLLDIRCLHYSAAGAGHSALTQQESAFTQQVSAFWQQESCLAQHSVFGQHLSAHLVSFLPQQQATVKAATAASNIIFFITLNSF
jgi:hypothetical protein